MKKRLIQRGFTIIELMIATVVFTVVLLVITTGILDFTRQYYRGVISTQTQSTARSIMDMVTHDIQFGDGTVSDLKHTTSDPVGTVDSVPVGYCIGQTERYSFSRNVETGSDGNHAFIVDTVSGCSSGSAALDASSISNLSSLPASSKPQELLGDHMRLVKFDITPVDPQETIYDVDVRIAYGDNDLLCSPSIPSGEGSCQPGAAAAHAASVFDGYDDLKCRSAIGNQYCAVSELHTSVQRRIQ